MSYQSNGERHKVSMALWGKKLVSTLLICLIFVQSISFVYASTDQLVEMLSTSYSYKLDSSNPNQLYTGVLGSSAEYHIDGINYFYDTLKDENYKAIEGSGLAPISVGDITIFVPFVPEMPLRIGSPTVEAGLIRIQMTRLLGKGWISGNGYLSYNQQSYDLYTKGLALLKKEGLKFGQPLPEYIESNLTDNIILPELRLAGSQEYLFPIVYLTESTIAAHQITGSTIAADSANFDAFSFAATGVDINIRRNALIKVRDDLILTDGTITAGEELSITAGRNIENYSGTLSGADVNLIAEEIYNGTLVTQYDNEYGYDSQFGNIGTITSLGDINIYSSGDTVFEGGAATAQGDITIQADGNIILISAQATDTTSQSGYKWEYEATSMTNLQTHISAADSISLLSNGMIHIQGAEVEAGGILEILAAYGIQVVNDMNYSSTYSYMEWDESGPIGTEGSETEKHNREEVVRALLRAGKDLRIHSGNGDITLRAVRVVSDGIVDLIAPDGTINMELAISRDLYDYVMQDDNATSIYNHSKGHVIETVSYNEFEAKGGIQYEAGHGIFIEVGQQEGQKQKLDVILDKLAEAPSLAWMNDLENDPNFEVSWEEVEFVIKEWDEEFQGLTPEVMAVIAIALAVVTAGAGAALAGATATAGASASVVATAAMTNAAFTSIVTTATLSLGNNGGDLRATFKELGSDDNLKSLATTMITAGVVSYVNVPLPETATDAATTTTDTANAVAETASLADKAYQGMTNAFISVSVDMLVNQVDISEFEDQFKVALTQQGISLLGELAANQLSGLGAESRTELGPTMDPIGGLLRYAGHVALGCVLGAATSDSSGGSQEQNEEQCVTGGLGAFVGEITAELYIEQEFNGWLGDKARNGPPTDAELQRKMLELQSHGVDTAKLTAAIGAFLAGADVNTAAMTAENAAENNAFFLPILYIMLVQAAAVTVYTVTIGDGNIVDGLLMVNDGTDPISQKIADAEDAVIEYAVENNPEAAAYLNNIVNILDGLTEPMAEGVVVFFEYIDESGAIQPITGAWNELTTSQQEILRASATMVLLVMPAAVLNRIGVLSRIDNFEPDMLNDRNHPSNNNLTTEETYGIWGNVSLSELDDRTQDGGTFNVSYTGDRSFSHEGHMREGATKNNGNLGEAVVGDFLEDLTGNRFIGIQSSSGHGADGIFIDHTTDPGTIHFIEIKSSINGVAGAQSATGNPGARIDGWIDRFENPTDTFRDTLTADGTAMMIALIDNRADYSLNSKWIEVEVPRVGDTSTGLEVRVTDWRAPSP